MGKSGKKKLKNSSVLDEFHNQIGKLQDGTDRLCNECSKIYPKEYFKYKTVDTCIYCYPKNKKTSTNYKINPISNIQEVKINEINPSDVKQCKYCRSYNITSKGNRGDSKRLVCNDCGKSWSVPQYLYNSAIKGGISSQSYPTQNLQSITPIDDNKRIDQLIKEIQYKKDHNLPLIVYYKDDSASTRTFYEYYVYGKYLKVKGKDHYYTYLLKDIREIL